ncbi:heme-binding protein [Flavobacterium sp. j3]|uniref:Heme-binding protein n=1 Tax=Flavobacterium aureirubrum TaxID=3133147 RepID=A0ABU9N8C4_9FLAO
MKTAVIIGSIVLILFVVFQLYISRATKKSENQPYKVIRVEKDFEIRFYPSSTMAMITSSAKNYRELSSSGFKKLATYIFGGNKDNKQIAMTSPVHMDINDSISSMSFVMPANYNKDNLPIPNNSEVTIKTVPEEYVAVITFGGFASDESIKKQTALLEKALKEYQIYYYGHFRYLGYNPPYQLFGRRNEIIISVNNNFK